MEGNTAHPSSLIAMRCNTYILLDKIKKSHFGTLVSQFNSIYHSQNKFESISYMNDML